MVLVDTSVWIDHFRSALPALADALGRQDVLTHSIVIGELASGNLKRRSQTLSDLRSLPRAKEATFDECLHLIETHALHSQGLGWNDLQLLASARLSSTQLWSSDKRLHQAASDLHLAYKP
ncbi:MAG: type II toxin-antitoxin system VapC family toxin [Terrimicrobiaceae bacterium]